MQISAFPGMSSMQAMHQRMFQQADADGDGGLTLDEFKSIGKNAPAGAAKPADAPSADDMFTNLDKDGDGKLTAAEMEPPKPQFSTASMTLLLQIQSVGQSSSDQQPVQGAASDDDTTSMSTEKLSQLLQALLNGLQQTDVSASTDVVGAVA